MNDVALHRLVAGSAAAHGDRLAVTGSGEPMSYARLDTLANALAARLAALGAGRGDRVVLWAEKSPVLVAAMQATLRLGAAYVPVEPSSPASRAAFVAGDCGARVVLTDADRLDSLDGEGVACHDVAEVAAGAPAGAPPVSAPVAPDDLAYVLYTSGSTGTPKGVCVSHRAARAFVDWAVAELRATPDDRFANHASFAFDLSVLDLYAAFSAGASVHLVRGGATVTPQSLVDVLRDERISIWYSVPSALSLMIRHGGLLDRPAPESLRAVLFAGEPFPVADVRRLAAWTRARLLNLYGPTETNVCTWHEVRPSDLERDRPVPIGVAASGDRVWACRPDGAVCGPGEQGELVVDGPSVMLGYWGRAPHTGPYRTGDTVEVLPDGVFDYLGRRDDLVKIRGFRVELGEIEATLMAHDDVAQAAAAVLGSGIDARLVAFVVPEPGRRPGLLSLKRHISGRLPRYMTTDELRVIDDLPRTSNGKLDRAALAALATGPD